MMKIELMMLMMILMLMLVLIIKGFPLFFTELYERHFI